MSRGEEKAMRWRPWRFSLRCLMLLMFGSATFFGGWKSYEWKFERDMRRENEEQLKMSPIDVRARLDHFKKLNAYNATRLVPTTEANSNDRADGVLGSVHVEIVNDTIIIHGRNRE